jgi:hypothetical protein
MAYDPSGDRRLEGDDILKILATHLNVSVSDLTAALIYESNRAKQIRIETEKATGTCNCFDL